MDFKRYDGETEEQLLYRIGRIKDELGYSWKEVATIMNNLLDYDYSESKYRKAFKKMISNNLNDNDDADEFIVSKDDYNEELDKLTILKRDIKAERIKIQTLNLERNRLNREDARQELFYEQIGQYIKSRSVEKLKPLYTPKKKNIKYLLGIADIHANAKWKTPTNEYSMEIVKNRLSKLLSEIIVFIKEKQLDELNIILLGDLIDGCLRMSNLQTMDSTVAKSVADISDMLIGFLEVLVDVTHIHINLFDVVYSNHSMPRFLQNYDIREDLGYTINRYIRTGLRNNQNIDIYSPLDGDICLDFKIWDFNIIGFHGHTEKNQNEAIKNFTIDRRKLYDYAVNGHLHSNQKTAITIGGLHDVESIQFPSFCGDDPYANSIHKISKGSCMICGFDKDYGFIESHKIILN